MFDQDLKYELELVSFTNQIVLSLEQISSFANLTSMKFYTAGICF